MLLNLPSGLVEGGENSHVVFPRTNDENLCNIVKDCLKDIVRNRYNTDHWGRRIFPESLKGGVAEMSFEIAPQHHRVGSMEIHLWESLQHCLGLPELPESPQQQRGVAEEVFGTS